MMDFGYKHIIVEICTLHQHIEIKSDPTKFRMPPCNMNFFDNIPDHHLRLNFNVIGSVALE